MVERGWLELRIDGMTCGHCEASVRDTLERLGATEISVDRESGRVRLVDPRCIGRARMTSAIAAIGFEAQ